MPGFRKGKVPPQLVIQRVGREAVLEQALRDSLPEWYERAIVEAGPADRRRPEARRRPAPRRGRGAGLPIEIGVRPPPRWATTGGSRSAEPSRGARRGGRGGARPPARGLRQPEPRRARGRRGRRRPDGLRGHDRRRAVRGRRGHGLHDRARIRRPDARVRGRARRQVGRRRGAARRHLPRTTTSRRTSRARRRPSRSRSSEVREKELPELDDDFAQSASEFDTLDELRDEIRTRTRIGARSRVPTPSSARPRSRPRPTRPRSSCRTSWSTPGRTRCGTLRASARAAGDRPADVRADAGQGPPRADRRGGGVGREALRREATLAAVAEAEGIEVSDDDLLEALGPGRRQGCAREDA